MVAGLAFRIDVSHMSRCIIAYDKICGTLWVLLEAWGENAEQQVIDCLKDGAHAAWHPPIFLLAMITSILDEFRDTNQTILEICARIRQALDLEPFQMRTPDPMLDFSDPARTTLILTKTAQEAASLQANLETLQELLDAAIEYDKEYYKRLDGPHKDERATVSEKVGEQFYGISSKIRREQRRIDMQIAMISTLMSTVRLLVPCRNALA